VNFHAPLPSPPEASRAAGFWLENQAAICMRSRTILKTEPKASSRSARSKHASRVKRLHLVLTNRLFAQLERAAAQCRNEHEREISLAEFAKQCIETTLAARS